MLFIFSPFLHTGSAATSCSQSLWDQLTFSLIEINNGPSSNLPTFIINHRQGQGRLTGSWVVASGPHHHHHHHHRHHHHHHHHHHLDQESRWGGCERRGWHRLVARGPFGAVSTAAKIWGDKVAWVTLLYILGTLNHESKEIDRSTFGIGFHSYFQSIVVSRLMTLFQICSLVAWYRPVALHLKP